VLRKCIVCVIFVDFQCRVKESALCGLPWFLSEQRFFSNSQVQCITVKNENRNRYSGSGIKRPSPSDVEFYILIKMS